MKKFLILTFLLCCYAQNIYSSSDDVDTLFHIFSKLKHNTLKIPFQEKIYLHLDNSSYYQNDKIWFTAYVVTNKNMSSSRLSKTLYVELLNPGGKVVDRKILRINNGRCNGELQIGQLPFYSGFYEVRAYTRYMVEYDESSIFSRVIPVYDKPIIQGDYSKPKMLNYGSGKYVYSRPEPIKRNKLNLKIYPEGGHLVKGLKSKVACEVTDKDGLPLNVRGCLIDKNTKKAKVNFEITHNGRASFEFTPDESENVIEVQHEGKSYFYDIPTIEDSGLVMSVDNLDSDSIGINIIHNMKTPVEMLGLAITCRGNLCGNYIVDFGEEKSVDFKINRHSLPAGVLNFTLFDRRGNEISDRLIFNNLIETIHIDLLSDYSILEPYKPVELTFSLKDSNGNISSTPFSLSVADSEGYVMSGSNLLSEMLLASDLKGYIHNPSYYFEDVTPEKQKELDCLMMIQGYKRYSWETLLNNPIESLYPESGIEVRGNVVSFVKGVPKPDVNVSVLLIQDSENESNQRTTVYDEFITDSLGRFSFSIDIEGKWDLIMSVSENGKKKDHRIILDRNILPDPRRYDKGEMIVVLDEKAADLAYDDNNPIFEQEELEDTIISKIDKGKLLEEVTVTAKKGDKSQDIYKNRASSTSYYNIEEERDLAMDKGIVIGQSFNDLLLTIDPNFSKAYSNDGEYIVYKGKEPLYVIDYERNYGSELEQMRPNHLYLESIKSIYLNENPTVMVKYANPDFNSFTIDKKYGCAVFIETNPDSHGPTNRNSRKSILNGYSKIEEFYSPDYSYEPTEEDFRRTLYWNPEVKPDENGVAKIRFYNNGTSKALVISAETIGPDGIIGILHQKISTGNH